ncbi:MAG: type II toxin-antitoxin system PemK/MazF family toxin [Nanoarchaeota archaeon]
MKFGINYKQRDIVLIPFPYSDLSTSKQRPAVVLSGKSIGQDLVCCAITTNPQDRSYSLSIDTADLEEGFLYYPSKIKPMKLFAIHKNKILKKLGRLNLEKSQEIVSQITEVIRIN